MWWSWCCSSSAFLHHPRAISRRLRRQKSNWRRRWRPIGQLASADDLTGLLNRRAMLDRMQLERRGHLRSGSAAAELPSWTLTTSRPSTTPTGHAAGNLVLQTADTVRRNVRNTDVLARWGARVCAAAVRHPAADAVALMERLRQAVPAVPVPVPQGGQPIP